MWRNVNLWGLILAIFCLFMSLYSFCSFRFLYIWSVAPPPIYILGLLALAFVMGILGFKSRIKKARSVITIFLSLGLSMIILLGTTFTREVKIKSTQSPDHDYKINFYMINEGAAVSPFFIGYIDGPLWFKKRIYTAGIEDAPRHIVWKNDNTISVNNHRLDLKKGQIYDGFRSI